MAQLFAAYLTQKLPSAQVSGEYDPEQELWVGDNQLQGGLPTTSHTTRGTFTGPGPQYDRDTGTDTDWDNS